MGDRLEEVRDWAKRFVLKNATERFENEVEEVDDGCESPIEKMFAYALYARLYGFDERFIEHAYNVKIGPYRVDVLLEWTGDAGGGLPAVASLIVELDGHDFHEKTKEQAARDKKRDRYLQSLGYRVLRYSGSEIWRAPGEAAHEAVSQLSRMVNEKRRQSA